MRKFLVIGLVILTGLACTPGPSTTQEQPLPTWQKVVSGPPQDLYMVRFEKDGFMWQCFMIEGGGGYYGGNRVALSCH